MTYDPGPYHRRLLTALMEVMSDDTHRWLLEQMGGTRIEYRDELDDGDYIELPQHTVWVVPEKETK